MAQNPTNAIVARLEADWQVALTTAEQASPLARRPYDLRHACLSTWLNGGVYPTQVAEWAGHSAWTCCCASTPSASWASPSWPSAGSAKRCARTDMSGRRPPGKPAFRTSERGLRPV